MKLSCEALEVRITPTTSVWSGLGATPNWSTGTNWVGGDPPTAGNDLDFPNGAAQLTNNNDLAAGTSFSSITIDGANYDLQGNQITLTGGINAAYATGNSSTIEFPIALTGTSTIQETAGSALSFSNTGVISGAGSIVESGPGLLYIQTASTYTGSTTVNNSGFLIVTGSIASSSGTTVASTGTLSGSGTVGSVTSTGGTVGYTTGPLANILTGTSLSLNSDSTFHAAINGTLPGGLINGHDEVVLSGALALGGATLNTTNFFPYFPIAGDSIVLITGATSSTGAFNGLPEGSSLLVGGQPFAITYQGGIGGHDVVLNFVQSTTTTVTASANPSTIGSAVTFTATVAAGVGTPTGTVTFMNGATSLGTFALNGAGVATLSTSALPLGTTSITAVYSGDAGDATSTSAVYSQVVNQAVSTTVVTASPDPTSVNQTKTLTATVTSTAGTPTGTVSFYEGITFLSTVALDGTGVASLSTANLPVGPGTISAVYSGDANNAGSTGTDAILIIQDNTNTSLSSPTPSSFGQSITLTASVTTDFGAIPTGTVSFFDGPSLLGTVTLDSGSTATFTTASLAVGSHSLTADYNGDTNDAASNSTPFSQVVNQAAATASLTSTPNPSSFGQTATLTVLVAPVAPGAGIPTGTVSFFDGSSLLGTVPLDGTGTGTLTTSTLDVGAHAITAVYGGDVDFTGATSAVDSQTVDQAATTTVVNTIPNPSAYGQTVTLIATATPVAPGVGIPTGSVSFFDGTTLLGSAPLGGMATAVISTAALSAGEHAITAVYAGDTGFSGDTSAVYTQTVVQATTTATLTAAPSPSTFGQSVTLTTVVTPVPLVAGTPTGSVSFFDGSTLLGSVTLDGTGTATLSTSALSVGTHVITSVYSNSDGNFAGTTASPASETVNQADTTLGLVAAANPSVYGQSVTLTATATPTAPGAGDAVRNGLVLRRSDSARRGNAQRRWDRDVQHDQPLGRRSPDHGRL